MNSLNSFLRQLTYSLTHYSFPPSPYLTFLLFILHPFLCLSVSLFSFPPFPSTNIYHATSYKHQASSFLLFHFLYHCYLPLPLFLRLLLFHKTNIYTSLFVLLLLSFTLFFSSSFIKHHLFFSTLCIIIIYPFLSSFLYSFHQTSSFLLLLSLHHCYLPFSLFLHIFLFPYIIPPFIPLIPSFIHLSFSLLLASTAHISTNLSSVNVNNLSFNHLSSISFLFYLAFLVHTS